MAETIYDRYVIGISRTRGKYTHILVGIPIIRWLGGVEVLTISSEERVPR